MNNYGSGVLWHVDIESNDQRSHLITISSATVVFWPLVDGNISQKPPGAKNGNEVHTSCTFCIS